MYSRSLFLIQALILKQGSENVLCFVHSVASRFCRYASYIVGIEWEMRGMEYWDNDECYIVISNHQSSLDILGTLKLHYNRQNFGSKINIYSVFCFSKKLFRNV